MSYFLPYFSKKFLDLIFSNYEARMTDKMLRNIYFIAREFQQSTNFKDDFAYTKCVKTKSSKFFKVLSLENILKGLCLHLFSRHL